MYLNVKIMNGEYNENTNSGSGVHAGVGGIMIQTVIPDRTTQL